MWRDVEGCAGVWRDVEGDVQGCGGMWRDVQGCGGMWRVRCKKSPTLHGHTPSQTLNAGGTAGKNAGGTAGGLRKTSNH